MGHIMGPPCGVVKLTGHGDLALVEVDGSTLTFKVICLLLCESLKALGDTVQHVGHSSTSQLLLLISPPPLVRLHQR